MHRKRFHAAASAALLLACGSMTDPARVADKFVDKYYVESDQNTALPLTTGVAQMRLKEELALTAEARREQSGMQLRQVRGYYSRKSFTAERTCPDVDTQSEIRPQS